LKLPFISRGNKKKNKGDYEFSAENGFFSYKISFKASSTLFFNLYNSFFARKVKEVKGKDIKGVDEWSTDCKYLSSPQRWLLEKRLFKMLGMKKVFNDVREERPQFMVYKYHLNKFSYKKLSEKQYLLTAEIFGNCSGE